MSFQDSAVIFFLALLLFGPKKLPELARQLGKLMGEFRRASNEFRMQMEDELRVSEQNERQKQIAAIEAAAPPTPPVLAPVELREGSSAALPAENKIAAPRQADQEGVQAIPMTAAPETPAVVPEPLPIAVSGSIRMMPPDTGLPVSRAARISEAFDSIPQVPSPATAEDGSSHV